MAAPKDGRASVLLPAGGGRGQPVKLESSLLLSAATQTSVGWRQRGCGQPVTLESESARESESESESESETESESESESERSADHQP